MRSKSIAIAILLSASCAGAQNYTAGAAVASATNTVAGVPLYYVPANAIMVFTSTVCPNGWTEFTASRGLYIVSRAVNGSTGTVVGSALSQGENRPVGVHNHTVTDPGHTHDIVVIKSGTGAGSAGPLGDKATPTDTFLSNSNTTGVSVDNAGNVAGTNAPYIQLLTCVKN